MLLGSRPRHPRRTGNSLSLSPRWRSRDVALDPDPGQPDQQQAVRRTHPQPADRSLVHGDLVTQGKVPEGKVAEAAAEEGEETEEMEQESDH